MMEQPTSQELPINMAIRFAASIAFATTDNVPDPKNLVNLIENPLNRMYVQILD